LFSHFLCSFALKLIYTNLALHIIFQHSPSLAEYWQIEFSFKDAESSLSYFEIGLVLTHTRAVGL
jgi:hypothetical protein